jgi:exopolysaccharide biosynthesis polyprenyl glycosylphosphotransferase
MTQVSASMVDATPAIADAIPRPRLASHDLTETPFAASGRSRSSWAPVVLEAAVTSVTAVVVALVLAPSPVLVAGAVLVWLSLLAFSGHFRHHPLGETASASATRVLLAGVKAFVLAAASAPLLAGVADPGALLWLAVAFPLTSSAITLAVPARGAARVVVVGPPREVREVLAELGTSRRHQVVAVCLTRRTHTPFGDIPSYVGLDRATRAIAQHAAQAILVLPGRHVSPVALRRLQWQVAGTGAGLYLGTGLLDVAPHRTRVVSSSGLDVVHVAPSALAGPRRALKDVVERSLALLGVAVLLPVLVALAVLVRRDSPGPALFRQERIGKDGVPFEMLKFRSMTVTAETDRTGLVASNEVDGGVLFKIQQDPRVTGVGRWMRRYSLDELPQLWNVVRGEMSLVGPRPALPGEVARYDLDPRRRLVVKPGLTGLWQVSGRSDLSWEQSVRLDIRYVDNWSLRLDAEILVRTVRAVLGHRGAY